MGGSKIVGSIKFLSAIGSIFVSVPARVRNLALRTDILWMTIFSPRILQQNLREKTATSHFSGIFEPRIDFDLEPPPIRNLWRLSSLCECMNRPSHTSEYSNNY